MDIHSLAIYNITLQLVMGSVIWERRILSGLQNPPPIAHQRQPVNQEKVKGLEVQNVPQRKTRLNVGRFGMVSATITTVRLPFR